MLFPHYRVGTYIDFIQVIPFVFFFNILLLYTHFALCIQKVCNWTTFILWLESERSAALDYYVWHSHWDNVKHFHLGWKLYFKGLSRADTHNKNYCCEHNLLHVTITQTAVVQQKGIWPAFWMECVGIPLTENIL